MVLLYNGHAATSWLSTHSSVIQGEIVCATRGRASGDGARGRAHPHTGEEYQIRLFVFLSSSFKFGLLSLAFDALLVEGGP